MHDKQEKIRKLLRLAADNPNPNEAATAYAQAQRLATLYDLDLDDIEDTHDEPPPPRNVEGIERWELGVHGKRIAWRWYLAHAIAVANNCSTYSVQGRQATLMAYGQPSDLRRVVDLYNQIAAACDYQARIATARYKADPDLDPRWDESPRSYARSFRLGYANAVAAKLEQTTPAKVVEEQRALAAGDVVALVPVDAAAEYLLRVAQALDDERDRLRLRSAPAFQGARSSRGYRDGRKSGSNASTTPNKELN